jgi:hypothetical protein
VEGEDAPVDTEGMPSSFASTRAAARQYMIVSRLHEGSTPTAFGSRQHSCSAEKFMKGLSAYLGLLLIVGCLGCSGNDKDRATQPTGSMPSSATTTAGAEGAGAGAGQPVEQVNPESSGGTSLPVSTPYNDGKGQSVSQNLNAAPFLTARQSGAGSMPKQVSSTGLVSRADGTMYGPSDLSAAGVGPGMQGAAQSGSFRGSKGTGAGSSLSGTQKPPSNQTSGK